MERDRSGTLNRNDYFEAGLDLLAEGGVQAQTIANLCERLGITKGSFYHHFSSLGDFRAQLLGYWEAAQQAALEALVPADPGHGATVLRTLEDAPFYARSVVKTHLLGRPVTAMHESLCLDRFSRQWVRVLLPFRMPRALR